MNKQKKQSILARMMGVALSMWLGLAGGTANATAYDFGNLLSGNGPTTASFANLSVTDTGGGVWDFLLTINNSLFSSFGDQAFIGSLQFDFNPDPGATTSTFLDSNVGGVSSVSGTSGDHTGGVIAFDFGTNFGQGARNRLSQNDYVHWSVSGLNAFSSLDNMYIHVQGIGANGNDSAKYTPLSPVPEPQTYAMLLVGLGLLGLSTRRKKNDSAF
ncbi:MAG: FxDxF family PEP-CTERM protein [Gammaproteobacteria bacterium]|nr:FxDxF family PEP-CTERM protein [Gammaproteobacteria bacterium]MBU1776622.1 FxDxF family PEP-CTERM protein [Gammaproteobacteria bacterium]